MWNEYNADEISALFEIETMEVNMCDSDKTENGRKECNEHRNGLKTITAKYYYLDVELDFGNKIDGKCKPCFTKEVIKLAITNAVKKLFGEFGGATVIDVLSANQQTRKVILRCPASFYVKLHSSLTLATHYEGFECYYRVVKASNTLISLAYNSNVYNHFQEK